MSPKLSYEYSTFSDLSQQPASLYYSAVSRSKFRTFQTFEIIVNPSMSATYIHTMDHRSVTFAPHITG